MKPRGMLVFLGLLLILAAQVGGAVAQVPYDLDTYSGQPGSKVTIYNYYSYPSACYVQGWAYASQNSWIVYEDTIYSIYESAGFVVPMDAEEVHFYCGEEDQVKVAVAAGQYDSLYSMTFDVSQPEQPPTDVPPVQPVPQTVFVESTTAMGTRGNDGCAANATVTFLTNEDTIYLVARVNNVLKGQAYNAEWYSNGGQTWVYESPTWVADQFYSQLCMSFRLSAKNVYFQAGNWYAEIWNLDKKESAGVYFRINEPTPTNTPRPRPTATYTPIPRPTSTRLPATFQLIPTATFIVLTDPPVPERLPDLAIESTVVTFEGKQARLEVRFANQGDRISEAGQISAKGKWSEANQPIARLNPGETDTVQLTLEYADDKLGQNDTINVSIVQAENAPERRYDNNSSTTTLATIPTTTPCTTLTLECIVQKIGEAVKNSPIEVTITIGAGVILTFVAGRISKVNLPGGLTLEEWEQQAKTEEPSQPCEENRFYCKKVKIEGKVANFKVVCLHLTAYDPSYPLSQITREVKGIAVDELNNALNLYRRRSSDEKLQQALGTAGYHLLRDISGWVGSQPAYKDVAIVGHLEGSDVTFKFTLYKCVKVWWVKRAWKVSKTWTKKIKDTRSLNVTVAHDVQQISNPPDSKPLIPSLMNFIQQV